MRKRIQNELDQLLSAFVDDYEMDKKLIYQKLL